MRANGRKRIVILGGGFGGIYTAMHLEKQLAHDPNVDITLENRENFFLFTPMLHGLKRSCASWWIGPWIWFFPRIWHNL